MEHPLATAVRDAVASGEYQKALPLWQAYCEYLVQRVRERELQETELAEAARLVEWTRTTALIARTHGYDDLAQRRVLCRVVQAYSGITPG